MKCPNCGAETVQNASFCNQCFSKFTAEKSLNSSGKRQPPDHGAINDMSVVNRKTIAIGAIIYLLGLTYGFFRNGADQGNTSALLGLPIDFTLFFIGGLVVGLKGASTKINLCALGISVIAWSALGFVLAVLAGPEWGAAVIFLLINVLLSRGLFYLITIAAGQFLARSIYQRNSRYS